MNKFRLDNGSADLTKETELVLQQSVELETQRVALLQKREEVMRRFTPNHPVVQALDGQLRQIAGEQVGVSLRVKGLPDTQQELLSLARDMEVNSQLYTALLNSSQELQIAKAGTVGNVRVIDYALTPVSAAKPKKGMILVLGVVLGIFGGMAAVFIRQALRHGVRDPIVVEQHVGLPTYATIPFADEQRRMVRLLQRGNVQGAHRILAAANPSVPAVEALRSLRTSLHFALLEASNNVVMLTGPSPSVGKSFVAINLGAVLAMSGKRVVVVDADLRRGHLHEYFSAPRAPGVSDFIAGGDLASIVRTSPVSNLHLIPTGTLPPNPAELLLHGRFSELINTLSQHYDHVLIDTPPVLAVTDAIIIGQLASCTLLVLKAGEHPLRAIEESARRLRQAGVQLRGTVFNQVGLSGSHYGYGYGYGYGYKYVTAKK
jgi:tyrosine-protein kinase Etk/Wzc